MRFLSGSAPNRTRPTRRATRLSTRPSIWRNEGLRVVDESRAQSAHLLRRTSFAVDPNRIDRFASMSWADAVQNVLDDGAQAPKSEPPTSEEWVDVATWWVTTMVREDSGLRDRMAWFWHTLLTTNGWNVSDPDLVRQQLIDLRANGLGDYRTLLQGFVHSGALLDYLDASGSLASNPNENLARELMELFTVGHGHYDQDDVRSAARALAGWVVEDGEVSFQRERAFVAPLLFRGVQDDWDSTKIVDHLCDQPETAQRIAAKVWTYLVGTELDEPSRVELGRWWQSTDLDILALVERVLLDPTMPLSRLSRPRSGLEWYTAMASVTGYPTDDPWHLEPVGQVPYQPPNVGGWPDDDRWLAPGSMLARSSLAFDLAPEIDGATSSTTEEVLTRCGLHELSPQTRQAIEDLHPSEVLSPEAVALTKWRLALSSPEFSLA